ncbi:MAG: 4Fe-4S binding protein [Firmicutes bacterium]|nr:4Fe-4S binding protein [Bacillota bacterium]
MIKQKVVLHFPASTVEQPFIYYLVRDFDLMVNILRARINPRKEGSLVVELGGDENNFKKGIDWLKSKGVKIDALKQQIIWREDRCTHCGVCSIICPSGALYIERPEMTVVFDETRCIACEHCLKTCPARAMETLMENAG